MNGNNMINYQIMNNIFYQNMLCNAYINQNCLNQGNFLYLCQQNNFFQNCTNFYNQQNIYYYKQNDLIPNMQNKPNDSPKKVKKEKKIEKEEKYFDKINTLKFTRRRRFSNTTTSSTINSNLSEENEKEEEKEKEEIKEINQKSLLIKVPNNVLDLKRRLSNISEANSETSKNSKGDKEEDDDLNDSFFSDTEEQIEKKEVKKENRMINLKKNKNEFKKDFNNKKYEGNPAFENTEILRVNVKITKDKNAVFKLKRYDDVFETIKLFCEINSVDEKLIKPLIIKSLSTLNTIYQIMNCKLDKEQIDLIQKIKKY